MRTWKVFFGAITAILALCATAGAATFSNPGTIMINGGNVSGVPTPATPYPSQVTVAGGPTSISSFTVTLNSVLHDGQKDIDVFLRGPGGQAMTLVSDNGLFSGGNPPATLTFSETASAMLTGGESVYGTTAFASGTYLPSDNDFGMDQVDCLFDPTPTGGNTTSFFDFKGTNANGVWDLFVSDDCEFESGTIAGWSITFPDPPPAPSTSTTPTPPVTTPPVSRKKCKKGRKLRRGRCVKKKKK